MEKSRRLVLFSILIVASFLRLWQLDKVPVSLFGDELDVGYHAYSVVKTGRDYSGNFLPLHFQSLAEWRTPLFIYSTVPSVALFGITAWGVRLPAAIFGVLGVWGIGLLANELFDQKKFSIFNFQFSIGAIASFVLAFSPWHIQYSRAAFEVTMLISFYIFGLLFLFKSINQNAETGRSRKEDRLQGKWLWLSAAFLVTTPLVYSTAKLFSPLLLIFLLIAWRREIAAVGKKYLFWAGVALFLFGLPTAYATLFSGGTQRFAYINVFTDPTRETEVGAKRETAARFRGETGVGLVPSFTDKLFYNKFTFWGQRILKNYFEPFSSEFLFIKGDLNLRHSIEGMGQFYKVEAIALIFGLAFFFIKFKDRRVKLLVAFWILAGVIPSAITRDGGRHATRLIIILPPLVFLIAYGLVSFREFRGKIPLLLTTCYLLLFSVNFIFYQKNYWTENPWYSERWWHSGYKEAIQSVKALDENYDRVLITMASEPSWIFFGSYYQYPPDIWQTIKPDKNWIDDPELGRITTIGKFYFASPSGGLYEWGKTIDDSTLFLASEKEVGINLIREPERTPGNLELLRSISYPSGEPAFYLFTGKVD